MNAMNGMTRKAAEAAIMQKMKEIREIALEYAPECDYISMFILGKHISICNTARCHEPAHALDCFEEIGDGKGIYSHPHGGEEDAEN